MKKKELQISARVAKQVAWTKGKQPILTGILRKLWRRWNQMTDASETKRRKAKELRYRKPIVKNVNLDFIKEDLYDIISECDNVQYWFDTDDETLINALDGDDDEAYEFKMMFGNLYSECEQMREDLNDSFTFIPECFDLFFVAIGAGNNGGGVLGWDSFEQDYFGLECTNIFAEEESAKKLKQYTKDQLVQNAQQCFKIYHGYLGIRHRYDCLKASMDILKDQNTGYIEVVKQIEEVYEKANTDRFSEYEQSTRDLDRLVNNMPDTAWLQ